MRIAICGWDDEAARQLRAFEAIRGVTAVGVGDSRASALVSARAATGLPCFGHVREMLRTAEYDAVLIGSVAGAPGIAEAAARRGAALLMLGSAAGGATLVEAAEAALRYHVPLVVLRPRLHQAGLAFVFSLASADSGWRPRFLDLSVSGTAVPALLRDANAIASGLLPESATEAVVSYVGDDPDEAPALAAELRYADGRLVSLRARSGASDGVTLYADCALGTLELTSGGGESNITMTLRDGTREQSRLPDRDAMTLEATRAIDVLRAGGNGDALRAPRDGVVLRALESALEGGAITAVESRSTRANLHVVGGTGIPSMAEPRAGSSLRLVGR